MSGSDEDFFSGKRSWSKIKKGRQEEQVIKTYHQILSKVFGGDYWQDILWNEKISPEEREIQLIRAYQNQLAQYLPFTGSCPVRQRTDTRKRGDAQPHAKTRV